MYGIELIIIIFATVGLSLAGDGPALSIIGVMIFWRVILGTGVGGDYPLSSIITSEFATVEWRGAMMAAVFANQGFGQFTCAFVAFICTVGFKDSLQSATCASAECQDALDKSWRVIYGFGAVPACFALYFRLTIPETIRYTLDVSRNEKVAAADAIKYVSGKHGSAKLGDIGYTPDAQIVVEATPNGPPQASFKDWWNHFSKWKNGKVLLGTAGSWFVLDVAFVRFIIKALKLMISVRSGPEYFYHSRRHRLFWRVNCLSKVRSFSFARTDLKTIQ
jgi:MFS transporter, PHS family, inorganic phosphate transporter